MQLDNLTKERLYKESLNNLVYFIFGILSNLLVFYISILVDSVINTFDSPITHLFIVPLLLSAGAVFLEIKFINFVCSYLDGWFVTGNIIGLSIVFLQALKQPNIYELENVELMAYNLLRYFTPVVVFVIANTILYMVLKFKFVMDCYLAANRLEIQKRIIEAQEEYNQKLEESGLADKEGEQPKGLLDKSRSLVEFVSDKLAKSIDPDYERDVHISDIDIDKELEERKKAKENKKKKK